MSPSAAEMATLTYYADVPEGPQLRLMLLELIGLTWRPVKITLPRQTDLAPLMALGPLLDVPAAELWQRCRDDPSLVHAGRDGDAGGDGDE